MSATLISAPAPAGPEDDEVLDREPCRCGALAAVVMTIDEEGLVTVGTRCACGSFAPVAADGSWR